jgi:hypothetical protein
MVWREIQVSSPWQKDRSRHRCGFQLYGFKDFEGIILQYPDSYHRMPEVKANA